VIFRTVEFEEPAAAYRAMSKVREIAHFLVWDLRVSPAPRSAQLFIPTDLVNAHQERIAGIVVAEGGCADWRRATDSDAAATQRTWQAATSSVKQTRRRPGPPAPRRA
jgi:hypothetical protein